MSTPTRPSNRHWAFAASLAALLGLLLAALLVAPAGATPAQTPGSGCGDPTYGCTSTTAPPPVTITCHAQFTGTPGGPQSAIVTQGPPNATAQVYLNGDVLASGQTDARGNATVPFQLPRGVDGSYGVRVIGASFNASCDPPVHWDGGGVHAASQANGAGGVGGGSGTSGLLAFTGFHLFLWLIIAAALLALGTLLRRASRSRRRHYL